MLSPIAPLLPLEVSPLGKIRPTIQTICGGGDGGDGGDDGRGGQGGQGGQGGREVRAGKKCYLEMRIAEQRFCEILSNRFIFKFATKGPNHAKLPNITFNHANFIFKSATKGRISQNHLNCAGLSDLINHEKV